MVESIRRRPTGCAFSGLTSQTTSYGVISSFNYSCPTNKRVARSKPPKFARFPKHRAGDHYWSTLCQATRKTKRSQNQQGVANSEWYWRFSSCIRSSSSESFAARGSSWSINRLERWPSVISAWIFGSRHIWVTNIIGSNIRSSLDGTLWAYACSGCTRQSERSDQISAHGLRKSRGHSGFGIMGCHCYLGDPST